MSADAPAWLRHVVAARALLFDFDGTLAPNLDLPDLRARVAALTGDRGVPASVFSGRYIVEMLDAGTAWLASRDPAAAAALHEDGHRLIRRFEVDAAQDTRPFDDIPGTLAALRDQGKALAVVTRNCRDAVIAVFPDILDYCDAVLARDDVTHLKPDARHLQQALDVLGHGPSGAIMVGDGQLDMHFGKSLGLYCIGVLSGSGDAPGLRQAGADAILQHAGELAAGCG